MQYPVYVCRDGDAGFRASFPDFPRAEAQGKSFGELKRNAQKVVELMYDQSEQLIPAPTNSTSELHELDMDDGEGLWMFIDINLARVTSKAVGVQISLLEDVLRQIDGDAKERHMTRSAYITLAAMHELRSRYGVQSATTPGALRRFTDG
ncbi:CopG family transcriptional regulator [Paraburkholderia terrae]|uniref:CopG family transcriptional regulator n=1 Tax=Paraburkholderia terrae TaxID=311230 RepID=A0ABM7TY48_9BURK|nr:type II toxin-antitoxin system HicB family antitoxin [Paraburkholderia terrae]BCZ84010.1 CopG family transcriptional regulator [Paraburkholderia terrae]